MVSLEKDWEAVVERKRAARQALLPAKWLIAEDELPSDQVLDVTSLCVERGWLSEEELGITTKTIVELSDEIKTGQLSSVKVVSAFAHRATISQQLTNSLTEINFEAALVAAESLDVHLKTTGEVIGPLHGVPISVKDQFLVKGLDTTMGYCSREGQIAELDSSLVGTLRKLGAIILAKTNNAHTLMLSETINPLWGRTVNPYNRSLTVGGSSGGEGALVSFRGSPLGFGTDIGGSIRVVAGMSMRDVADSILGQEAVRATPGPMCHSPEDIELIMRAYLSSEPWQTNPAVLRLPWVMDVTLARACHRFCFAIAYGDEVVTPHPATMRGLRFAAERLKSAGHAVVEWRGEFRVNTTEELIGGFWTADGGAAFKKDLEASGEPVYPDTALWLESTPLSIEDTWALQHRRTKHAEWWSDTWEATSEYTGTGMPIDGLISALGPYTAWPHRIDVGKDLPWYDHAYTFEQPLLDLASGTFPTGLHHNPAIDVPDKDFSPRSELDAVEYAKEIDPEKWRNGPIGLQVTGRRLEEEKVVEMLCKIRDALSQ